MFADPPRDTPVSSPFVDAAGAEVWPIYQADSDRYVFEDVS
jgi:hypothetical protein